jgi:hypothetical protein
MGRHVLELCAAGGSWCKNQEFRLSAEPLKLHQIFGAEIRYIAVMSFRPFEMQELAGAEQTMKNRTGQIAYCERSMIAV